MSFLFVLFYVCRLSLHFLLFLIYFIFLVAHSIKPTSTCFQLRSLRAKRNFARANSVHFFAIVLHDFNVRETS